MAADDFNGIFHYEPIYGDEKLQKIQENDERKFLLCQRAGISLAIIDSSSCKRLNQKAKDKYWGIFQSILQQ